MPGEKILFVDDDASLRKLFSFYLGRRGYQVQTANDGLEALGATESFKPHLIITDVEMPRVGGLELTRILRRNHRTARIPIIMLSAHKEAEDVLAGYAEGADDYVPKPVDASVLVAKLEFLLQRASAAAAPPLPKAPRGAAVLFLHGKGGVGTTTLLVSAALGIARNTTYRVAVLDLNLEFGNAALMLGLAPQQTLADLAASVPRELDDSTFAPFLQEARGVSVVAATNRPERAELVTIPAVHRALDYLRRRFDFVLVDTAPSFSEINMSALNVADAVCLVAEPHLAACKATLDCLKVLRTLNIPDRKVMLLLNRGTTAGLSVEQVSRFLGRHVDLSVPYSAFLMEEADRGSPPVVEPNRPGGAEMRHLADRIASLVAVGA